MTKFPVIFFSKMVISFACLPIVYASAVDTFNPCDPARKFCGRLTVFIAGAGELGRLTTNKTTGVKLDNTSRYILSNFLQFRRTSTNVRPQFSIVMTSDHHLIDALDLLPADLKKEAGYLGSIPTSIDSFEKFLASDSLLDHALDQFAECDACKHLINPESKNLSPGEKRQTVLNFLKIEIIIEGHSAGGSIAAWDNSTQVGSFADWEALNDRNTSHGLWDRNRIDKKLIGRLKQRLGNALLQTFVGSCGGAIVGQAFLSDNQCSGFVSTTDEDTTLITVENAPLNITHSRNENELLSLSFHPLGLANASAIIPNLMANVLITNSARSRKDQHNDDVNRVNPLLSFAYDSADLQVDTILAVLKEKNIEPGLVKKISEAGFVDELGELIPKVTPEVGALGKIYAATTVQRSAYSVYTDDKEENRDQGFTKKLQNFRNCIDETNPAPSNCKSLNATIKDAAGAKNGSGVGSDLTREINELRKVYDQFHASNLISMYHQKKIPLSKIFEVLHDLKVRISEFDMLASGFALGNGIYSDQLETTLNDLRDDLNGALDSAISQFYSSLRSEALKTKIGRIEATASLLDAHKNEVPESEALLENLANQLSCLTYFPVGPAFDNNHSHAPPLLTNSKDHEKW